MLLSRFAFHKHPSRGTIRNLVGRYLVRGGDIDVVEGSTPHDRFVVIEFESREIAENFYNDPRYVKVRKIRQAYSDGLIFQATGFESP